MIIQTKRFILRPYRKGDEKSLVENINDKNVSKFMLNIPYPYKPKDAKKWINNWLKRKKQNKKDFGFVLNINSSFALDIDGNVVGGIGLNNIEKHKAEIGYWLGKEYWDKGIMTEVVKLVTNFGFKRLKLRRIYAYIFIRNKASIRILKKNGYKCEGLLKKHHLKKGKFIDVLLYAKVK